MDAVGLLSFISTSLNAILGVRMGAGVGGGGHFSLDNFERLVLTFIFSRT